MQVRARLKVLCGSEAAHILTHVKSVIAGVPIVNAYSKTYIVRTSGTLSILAQAASIASGSRTSTDAAKHTAVIV